MSEELIFYKEQGQGPPLIILHGLFGSSDNWQSLANRWQEKFRVILADARNHGRSFHSEEFDYDLMAGDLKKLMDHLNLDRAFIIGHSMGGKTLMRFAQLHSARIKAAIVADIGPKAYPPHHDEIIEAFEAVDLEHTQTRKEAEEQVKSVIDDAGVVLFLLKNLYWKEKGKLGWRMNLKVLKEKITEVTPALPDQQVDLPFLFVRGGKSNYILNEDWPTIKEQFVNGHLVSLKNAGHWLHAEQPDAFYQTVNAYLEQFHD
ncbi:MAG: alpha/beta fold hydrolase [Luteibaculum sp.]